MLRVDGEAGRWPNAPTRGLPLVGGHPLTGDAERLRGAEVRREMSETQLVDRLELLSITVMDAVMIGASCPTGR